MSHSKSSNPTFSSIIEARLTRRDFLKAAAALTAAGAVPLAGCAAARPAAPPVFSPIGASTDGTVRIAAGYTARPFYKWGDPIGHPAGSPPFKPDATNTA